MTVGGIRRTEQHIQDILGWKGKLLQHKYVQFWVYIIGSLWGKNRVITLPLFWQDHTSGSVLSSRCRVMLKTRGRIHRKITVLGG